MFRRLADTPHGPGYEGASFTELFIFPVTLPTCYLLSVSITLSVTALAASDASRVIELNGLRGALSAAIGQHEVQRIILTSPREGVLKLSKLE